MTSIGSSQPANQISPVNERIYHQSNLLGDWKGTWTKNHQPLEFKVVGIHGDTAQIEYTHDGHTERGTGTVSEATITFGNVTIGTRDGTTAGFEFSLGTAKSTAILTKTAAPVDQNKLVGNWIGSTVSTGVSFRVLSIKGRDAQVQYTVNGRTVNGVGDVYKNTVTLGSVQVSADDGVQGTVTFPVGHSTLAVHVSKFTPPSANSAGSSVNKLA
jgi:hypothetical protein